MNDSPYRLCVAPMMDWTDRHCRFFLRLITRRARLYTEMITSAALMHGDLPHHLDFDPAEHPIALQLGGSDRPCSRTARSSASAGATTRSISTAAVRRSACRREAYGACLMAEPALVADCVKAMRDAVALPVTVKHRIGLDGGARLRLRPRFCRHGCGGGVRRVHRPCAQRRAERACRRRRTAKCRRCATTSSTGSSAISRR